MVSVGGYSVAPAPGGLTISGLTLRQRTRRASLYRGANPHPHSTGAPMFKPRRIPGRSRFAAFFDAPTPGRSLYSLLWREEWIAWCGSTYAPRYPAMVGRRPSYR